MTVYFNRSRDRWMYDFRRHGTRYQGYSVHPETGAPARNKREAQRYETLHKAQVDIDPPPERQSRPVGATTFAEVLAGYAENKARHARSWATQRAHLREFLAYFGAETEAGAITRSTIDAYVAWSRRQPVTVYRGGPKSGGERKETRRLRTVTTIRNYLATLRAAFRWAQAVELIPSVPSVPSLRAPDDMPNPIRPEDVHAILAAADPHLRDVLLICTMTGMRLRECLTLRWRQVDIARGVVTLDSRTKAGRGRAVYLNAGARAVFERLRDAAPPGVEQVILYRHKGVGKPRPVHSIRSSWLAALGRAGLSGQHRFHDTRAVFCTALADAGADPLAIKELAGHASFNTTLRYIKAASTRLRDVIEQAPSFTVEDVRETVRDKSGHKGPEQPMRPRKKRAKSNT